VCVSWFCTGESLSCAVAEKVLLILVLLLSVLTVVLCVLWSMLVVLASPCLSLVLSSSMYWLVSRAWACCGVTGVADIS
jgi:hypothetical protein